MHVDFDPFKVDWNSFSGGVGGGGDGLIQYGGEYAFFRGLPYQRGGGIGSVLRSFMMRYLLPIGKEIGMAVGRQGLESGNRVLGNVLEGKDLKESLVTEGRAGLKNLLEKAARNVDVQRQKQKGEGGNFDFKRYQKSSTRSGGKHINSLHSTIGPDSFLPLKSSAKKRKSAIGTLKNNKRSAQSKRLRFDALGTY